jgi:predicted SnoaL-like aldol condensation-catalyzing enzyme
MHKKPLLAFVALAALFCVRPVHAQPAAGSPEANKKLVLDFFHDVFEAQNIEAADRYLAQGYVQHNPLVASGRKGFKDYFGAKWKTHKPEKAELGDPPEAMIAEGDLVVVMWKVRRQEPMDKTKTYASFWFDMFRVKDGKLVEHWDNAKK